MSRVISEISPRTVAPPSLSSSPAPPSLRPPPSHTLRYMLHPWSQWTREGAAEAQWVEGDFMVHMAGHKEGNKKVQTLVRLHASSRFSCQISSPHHLASPPTTCHNSPPTHYLPPATATTLHHLPPPATTPQALFQYSFEMSKKQHPGEAGERRGLRSGDVEESR